MLQRLHPAIAGRPTCGQFWARPLLAALIASVLSGCATVRSYDAEMNQTLSATASGRVDAAIAALRRNNEGSEKDLLYYFELGELQRLASRYSESLTAWQSADAQIQAWEDAARADPARVAGVALSYIVNDKLRPYEGQDYEKVMLTTRMAMNDLGLGQWQNARVAIKRTHEREAVIATVRSREQQEVEEEARKRGASVSYKDLNGYPVQTIDNPEVNALRNSYQSAFSHYLAGFVYEALGEPSLAAAGYRQAIELHPNVPALERGPGRSRPAGRRARRRQDRRPVRDRDRPGPGTRVRDSSTCPFRSTGAGCWYRPPSRSCAARTRAWSPPSCASRARSRWCRSRSPASTPWRAKHCRTRCPASCCARFIRSIVKATAQYQAQRAASKRRSKGTTRPAPCST